MIRSEGPIKNIEDWVGQDAVLTLVIPVVGVKVERVLLTGITDSFILCRDQDHRDQVYCTHHLVGWEPYDAAGLQALESQVAIETLHGERVVPQPPLEDPGVREVGKIRKVIQPGGHGSPVKMK